MKVSFSPQRGRITIATNEKVTHWFNLQELGSKVSATSGISRASRTLLDLSKYWSRQRHLREESWKEGCLGGTD